MKKHYESGWVAIPGNSAMAVRTIPLNASWYEFDAEIASDQLGNAVRLALTGLRVEPLIGTDGTECGMLVLDLSRVSEFVDGHPVFDTWVICNGSNGAEVGIQIKAPNDQTIRIFSSASDTYIVQSVRHEFVIAETEGVSGVRLGETVMRLTELTALEL